MKTLGIYLSSGVLSNLATHSLNLSPHSLGASGSIYGLTGAMWAYYHTNREALGSEAHAGIEVSFSAIVGTNNSVHKPLSQRNPHISPLQHTGMENICRNIGGNLIYSFARNSRIDHYGHFGGLCGE